MSGSQCSQTWNLPTDLFLLIPPELSSTEIRALQLVCRDFKQNTDAFLTDLTDLTSAWLLTPQVSFKAFPKALKIGMDCFRLLLVTAQMGTI